MGVRLTLLTAANFGDDLRLSHGLSGDPAWDDYYHQLFPTLVKAVEIPADGDMQRKGVDRILFLENGQQLTVDEKVRRCDVKYRDVLLERYSDAARRTPGWAIDDHKKCDYVAYAIPYHKVCYFMPFPLLRAAFKEHGAEWREQFGWRKAPNDYQGRTWVTYNVPVPWPVLSAALIAQMDRTFKGSLSLPRELQQDAKPTEGG